MNKYEKKSSIRYSGNNNKIHHNCFVCVMGIIWGGFWPSSGIGKLTIFRRTEYLLQRRKWNSDDYLLDKYFMGNHISRNLHNALFDNSDV